MRVHIMMNLNYFKKWGTPFGEGPREPPGSPGEGPSQGPPGVWGGVSGASPSWELQKHSFFYVFIHFVNTKIIEFRRGVRPS